MHFTMLFTRTSNFVAPTALRYFDSPADSDFANWVDMRVRQISEAEWKELFDQRLYHAPDFDKPGEEEAFETEFYEVIDGLDALLSTFLKPEDFAIHQYYNESRFVDASFTEAQFLNWELVEAVHTFLWKTRNPWMICFQYVEYLFITRDDEVLAYSHDPGDPAYAAFVTGSSG